MSALPERLRRPKQYEVWPEHVDVVMMFLRVQTQWRTTMNGVMGLDYGVVFELARLQQINDPVQLLDDLQVMEQRARELLNKAANPKK